MRIAVLVVAYNAEKTLAPVLDRIPESFRPRISEILVLDDHSDDDTFAIGQRYVDENPDLPLRVLRNSENLGYGGNQKAGYRELADRGTDIVVLLHGDGQYAPECLPEMVAPFDDPTVAAVFGSRMLQRGAARAGGMPLYKFLGNRLLTWFENRMLRTSLSEFHSGYRAYRMSVLRTLPLAQTADDFNFDSQIIIQLTHFGHRIVEIPIPTFYGDEVCYVNGPKYAAQISWDVVRYRLGRAGVLDDPLVAVHEATAPAVPIA